MTQQRAAMPDETLRLEEFLPYRLNVLAAMVSEGLAKVYSERYGIDIPGWRVLATLGQFGAVTAKQIGEHSHMHKTKVSRAVSDLERRGLVGRSANTADKREAFVGLTPRGRTIYADIVPLARAYEEQILGKMTPAARQSVSDAIDQLTEYVRQRQDTAG